MENLNQIIAFVSLSLLVAASPGPSSLFIVSQGLSRDWRKPFAAVTGLVLANLTWVALCCLGIATVIRDSRIAFECLQAVGVAYLLYLGFSLLKSSRSSGGQLVEASKLTMSVAFTKGYLTSMSNPKAALFYLSFLPQFVSGQAAYHIEILSWGFAYVALVLVVMSFYGLLSFQLHRVVGQTAGNKFIHKTLGCGFLGSALFLWKYNRN